MQDKFLCPSTEMDAELRTKICKMFFYVEEVAGTTVLPREFGLGFHSVKWKLIRVNRRLEKSFSFCFIWRKIGRSFIFKSKCNFRLVTYLHSNSELNLPEVALLLFHSVSLNFWNMFFLGKIIKRLIVELGERCTS